MRARVRYGVDNIASPMIARARRGFTLLEMTMVLAVLAVSALVVIPQWNRANDEAPSDATSALTALLRDARRVAIDARQDVSVYVDPATGHYRVDTAGVHGMGAFAEGTLTLGALESLETTRERLRFIFQSTGAAVGDSVLVRGSAGVTLVSVDPWNGTAVVHAR